MAVIVGTPLLAVLPTYFTLYSHSTTSTLTSSAPRQIVGESTSRHALELAATR